MTAKQKLIKHLYLFAKNRLKLENMPITGSSTYRHFYKLCMNGYKKEYWNHWTAKTNSFTMSSSSIILKTLYHLMVTFNYEIKRLSERM